MKSEILKLLREADDYVSGQELCDRFDVSRTAIWKVINQLKEEGYSIEAVRNKGYHIVSSPDLLNKEEIESHVGSKKIGCHVVSLESTDSTNVQAKILAEQGCHHGTVVVADQQINGKGRRGRAWESPKGTGIFMSLVLRPTFAPSQAPMLTLVMAYSVVNGIKRYMEGMDNIDVQIKWPNDIVVNGKKVCGILTEMSTEIDYINYVVIGVGINANMESFPEEIQEVATSLKLELEAAEHQIKQAAEHQIKQETEHQINQESQVESRVHRARLIGYILEEFEVQYEKFCLAGNLSFLQEAYNKSLVNRDRQVRVLEPANEYEALALGIDERGELIVRCIDGEVKKVYAGEVSVRGIYGYV